MAQPLSEKLPLIPLALVSARAERSGATVPPVVPHQGVYLPAIVYHPHHGKTLYAYAGMILGSEVVHLRGAWQSVEVFQGGAQGPAKLDRSRFGRPQGRGHGGFQHPEGVPEGGRRLGRRTELGLIGVDEAQSLGLGGIAVGQVLGVNFRGGGDIGAFHRLAAQAQELAQTAETLRSLLTKFKLTKAG